MEAFNDQYQYFFDPSALPTSPAVSSQPPAQHGQPPAQVPAVESSRSNWVPVPELTPAGSSVSPSPSPPLPVKAKGKAKRKVISNACEPCRKRKSKCDGCRPCKSCINHNSPACTYNLDLDMRRKGSLRREIKEWKKQVSQHQSVLRWTLGRPEGHPEKEVLAEMLSSGEAITALYDKVITLSATPCPGINDQALAAAPAAVIGLGHHPGGLYGNEFVSGHENAFPSENVPAPNYQPQFQPHHAVPNGDGLGLWPDDGTANWYGAEIPPNFTAGIDYAMGFPHGMEPSQGYGFEVPPDFTAATGYTAGITPHFEVANAWSAEMPQNPIPTDGYDTSLSLLNEAENGLETGLIPLVDVDGGLEDVLQPDFEVEPAKEPGWGIQPGPGETLDWNGDVVDPFKDIYEWE